MSHSGVILGSFLDHSWVILGLFLGHSWVILESFLGHSWIILCSASCEMPKALHRDSPFCWSSIRNSLALGILNPGNTCNTSLYSLVEKILP